LESRSCTSTFDGRYKSLANIADFVNRAGQEAGLDFNALYAIGTAVDEACSNIIEHAYQGEGKGQIECTCTITDEGLVIVLRDYGQPFDPDRILPPNRKMKLKDHPGHGLGLLFMRKMMDEVRFEFSHEEGNTLTMLKRKEHHS
jgi:serine/threonine-protein kinase RsbW